VEKLSVLTAPAAVEQNPGSAGFQAPSAATGSAETQTPESANSGLGEIKAFHE
jgi:hypothetical protein